MKAKRLQNSRHRPAASNACTAAIAEARKRHGAEESLEKLRARLEERRTQLEKRPQFVDAKDKLLEEFECGYEVCPALLDAFLHMRPMSQTTQASKDWVEKYVKSPTLAVILQRYIKFSSRYDVYFRRLPKESRFEWRISDPLGWKFHARVSHGAVVPADGGVISHLAEASDFAAPNLQVPSPVQKLIDAGNVKFVQIDDADDTTLLSGLESLAHHESGATFFLHCAPRPHLWCLVGESLSKEDWDKLGKVVTDFQKSHFGGAKAGRPKNLKLAQRARNALSMPGTMKQKAWSTNPAAKFWTVQSYVSRTKKHEKDRKSELQKLKETLRKECSKHKRN